MEKLILVDTNPLICQAWHDFFQDVPKEQLEIVHGKFEDVPEYDCLVSPANSYGLMDGGIDLAIIKKFGLNLQAHVQLHINVNYMGEQPVGTCFIAPTGNKDHPYLAHTPTMKYPQDISKTDNVYQAFKAVLCEVDQFNSTCVEQNKIKTVLCPGLGGLTGRMSPTALAGQMRVAYESYFSDERAYNSWAKARQYYLRVQNYM